MSDLEQLNNNTEGIEQQPNVNTVDVSNSSAPAAPGTGPISAIVVQASNATLPTSDSIDIMNSPPTTEKNATTAGKLIHDLILCLLPRVCFPELSYQ